MGDNIGNMHNRNLSYSTNMSVQYAVVNSVISGVPHLRFSGETVNSAKRYVCLKSYVPEVGDRVMLLNDVIIGGWRV